MNAAELMPNTVVTGERNYDAALNLVIAAASHELLIFDQDFAKGDFASLNRFKLLHDFLNKSANNKLTIILQNTQFFTNNCPRLLELLTTYGHMMTVYETNDSAKVAKDCFVIADKQHYCRRFHADQARFKYTVNGEDTDTVSGLLMRYDELLAETANVVSISKLGL